MEIERDRLLQEIGEKLWGALQTTTDEGLKALYENLIDVMEVDASRKQQDHQEDTRHTLVVFVEGVGNGADLS